MYKSISRGEYKNESNTIDLPLPHPPNDNTRVQGTLVPPILQLSQLSVSVESATPASESASSVTSTRSTDGCTNSPSTNTDVTSTRSTNGCANSPSRNTDNQSVGKRAGDMLVSAENDIHRVIIN